MSDDPQLLSSARVKWLLLFVLGVFPALLVMATATLSFQRAETLSFCSSCHTMTPWVMDLKNSQSKAIAPMHYRNRFILHNQCYTCHVDYDFMGPVNAKVDGVRHIVAYYTGIGMHNPIKLYKPFPNNNCLQCHGASAQFQSQTHIAVMDQIKANSMGCVTCHNPIHTPQG
jgi:nitrate/TMAO reductase-like tetraheme cytochrome c subunit